MKKITYISLLILNSILLAGVLFYFFQGSLELFPTEEKQASIKEVTGVFSIIFGVVEVLLLTKIIKLYRKG